MNIFKPSSFEWLHFPAKLPQSFTTKDTPAWSLSFPVSRDWQKKQKRLLIVCETVDSTDLRNHTLCSDFFGELLTNLLREASRYASLSGKVDSIKHYGIAVVPFAFFKSYHLDPKRQAIANQAFASRTNAIIDQLQPTHVVMLGDTAARRVLNVENHIEKRGWVHTFKRDWGTFLANHTVDPVDLISVGAPTDEENEDEEEGDRDLYAKTNLLGQVFRDMSNLLAYGSSFADSHGLAYSAYDIKPNPVLLQDMDKVEALFSQLLVCDKFAYDTETMGLDRVKNNLLTMQFSLSPHCGFIVPYNHKMSPWFGDTKRLNHIRNLAYKLFCNPKVDPFGSRYIIGTNLQFDLTQTRQQLKIPLITWPTFDIQNGEFIHDENISELDKYAGNAPKTFSLAAICTRHGSTAYLDKDGFNKQDRSDMENSNLQDKSFLDYCALDTQLPFRIHELQIERARRTKYDKFFKMVVGQQSNLQHCMSVMEQVGVSLDVDYLKEQLKEGSPMRKVVDTAKAQLYDTEAAQQANKLLMTAQGLGGGPSLFGNTNDLQLFNIDKPEHRQILFSDILALEPVAGFGKRNRKEGKPTIKIGKIFQAEHREVYEVSLFTRLVKMSKLISSYIVSFYAKSQESGDNKLRPSFGYLYVKTGRGNSFNPSLQQTPSRGPMAKYVKRMFAAPAGFLKIKTDFSANEVRFAANIAGDSVMAEPFRVARSLRTSMFFTDMKIAQLKKELERRETNN